MGFYSTLSLNRTADSADVKKREKKEKEKQ